MVVRVKPRTSPCSCLTRAVALSYISILVRSPSLTVFSHLKAVGKLQPEDTRPCLEALMCTWFNALMDCWRSKRQDNVLEHFISTGRGVSERNKEASTSCGEEGEKMKEWKTWKRGLGGGDMLKYHQCPDCVFLSQHNSRILRVHGTEPPGPPI